MIIGLCGYGRSGKDTVGQMLYKHGYFRRAFADTLKDALSVLNPIVDGNGWWTVQDAEIHLGRDGAKDRFPEYRRLLQVLGTEVGREMIGTDVWVDTTFKTMDLRPDSQMNYVITDVRFANEAQKIKDAGGVVWRVTRTGFGPINDHLSEIALDDWAADSIIRNNGSLEDLEGLVADWLNNLRRDAA